MGKGSGRDGVEEREKPNILNIVARRNNLATFDSQQLATLSETSLFGQPTATNDQTHNMQAKFAS